MRKLDHSLAVKKIDSNEIQNKIKNVRSQMFMLRVKENFEALKSCLRDILVTKFRIRRSYNKIVVIGTQELGKLNKEPRKENKVCSVCR